MAGFATDPALNAALSAPWAFLCPTSELNDTLVGSAKYFLDPLALSISDAQSVRQRQNRKRKRGEEDLDKNTDVLQLKQLFVEGFGSDQIWEQALRILDSAGQEVQRDCTLTIRHADHSTSEEQFTSFEGSDFADESSEDSELGSHIDGTRNTLDVDEEVSMASDLDQSDTVHDALDARSIDEILDEKNNFSETGSDGEQPDTYKEDPFGLNDGFFSIDDFNKQSELWESQDTRGGPDNESESDEEVDWHADPLTTVPSGAPSKKTPSSNETNKGVDDDDASDEEGPIFNNVNLYDELNSDSDDADPGTVHGADWVNTSDIKYSDFFAPPPRKSTTKRSRPLPKTQPVAAINSNDIDRAMADVRRDLFEDDASIENSDVDDGELGEPETQKSTHEKQRARIADEIRRLEAASVAKKEWMLAGEARAAERPVNSLIEEDLEVERIGKPVPVVTAEVSEDIEGLVKRRILAREFDEVIRRRPGITDGQIARKSHFELEDSKAQQSLAELYETDHLRATDPNYVDPKNQKLMREHAEISTLWKEISSQLDTLSNWHYKPQTPHAHINVVTDVAAIMMEDAQPTAGGAVGSAATLAPQEIYTPGADGKASGEVVLRNGLSISREEMTREEKSRLRRQHKKQKKSTTGLKTRQPGKAAEKQQIVSDLKKGGVKLIGKQGEVTDIHGQKPTGTGPRSGADALKL
ncbi:U3 small nucleolar ribonucleo protein complex, subunit Mpp10 [Aspergillus pseudonomiae]|uniref:U3 small nucleolar ribonucleoprotein protein MPP10 n=1 Tax=Aspergillus pseudonomiae TaxID=1506151 RepID=A0A5N7D4V3_9EURO|nr:U3 small nucleolar ribonucleoprotein complex, subunit Mpp10 [Aspergillus pseudonomiae]KAB8257485.1 U3 small nucleolar ribonucleo protein complex, subunit Mpp10 [Aspergillus pseudonomiae]KAE8400828.1 U3 small nucleolar ribonucleo protein complex, subunit Mpp10 [Aspergillus pseudonomiae]